MLKVVAVVVCYSPDIAQLRQTCLCLLRSNSAVILVDNTEKSYVEGSGEFSDCTVITNGENVGVARAQNIGIRQAVDSGADVVVFFDQDSRIGPGFLPALLAPLTAGYPAVVAPVSYDAAKGFEYPSLKVSKHGLQQKVHVNGRVEPYVVDIVISSGTATTVETFDRAGEMDEEFFIDFVDTEWCLRCRRRNIPIHVVPAAVMIHSVGSRSIDLGFATVSVHSPLRCYYQIRNCLQLFRKESVPLILAARETVVVSVHKILLLMCVSNRAAYIKALAKGLYDGLTGATGKKAERSLTHKT